MIISREGESGSIGDFIILHVIRSFQQHKQSKNNKKYILKTKKILFLNLFVCLVDDENPRKININSR